MVDGDDGEFLLKGRVGRGVKEFGPYRSAPSTLRKRHTVSERITTIYTKPHPSSYLDAP